MSPQAPSKTVHSSVAPAHPITHLPSHSSPVLAPYLWSWSLFLQVNRFNQVRHGLAPSPGLARFATHCTAWPQLCPALDRLLFHTRPSALCPLPSALCPRHSTLDLPKSQTPSIWLPSTFGPRQAVRSCSSSPPSTLFACRLSSSTHTLPWPPPRLDSFLTRQPRWTFPQTAWNFDPSHPYLPRTPILRLCPSAVAATATPRLHNLATAVYTYHSLCYLYMASTYPSTVACWTHPIPRPDLTSSRPSVLAHDQPSSLKALLPCLP